jgi:uncharacterized protein (DUF924 family)
MYKEILKFWFEEIQPSQWWVKDEQLDQVIVERFADIHAKAIHCELYEWRNSAEGRLAEIIVLDQFSRNIYRESSLSFAYDSLALALSQEALLFAVDKKLSSAQRSFIYLPFMHSESIEIHKVAMSLYQKNGNQAHLDFEIKHKEIIENFGRYPHRNKVLGRVSTDKETEFLKQHGVGF